MQRVIQAMKISAAVTSGYVFLLAVMLLSVSLSAEEMPSDIEILKKISTASIRHALGETQNIDEAAARVGVDSDELKRICLALKIDLPESREKPAPVPVPIAKKKDAAILDTDIVLEYHGKSPYLLLVDKSEHKLYLVKYINGECCIEQVFACKTGKNAGDKQERGDHRTPEGVYFFTQKYTRPEIEAKVGKPNAFQYGEMAFVTDFPNVIDKMKNKNGGGIWLHGTDEPFESTPWLDTRGCVVTTNETIRRLSRYIELEQTPIIIMDQLSTAPHDKIDTERHAILSGIEEWRTAWAEKRIDDYIRHYDPSFISQGLTRDQWRERKSGLAKINGTVRISLDTFSILKMKDSMVVRFTQDYAADNLTNTGTKTLYLVKGESDWGIVAEFFRNSN